jgi:hypothetical protein
MTQDLQFLSNQNTSSFCVHTMTQLTNCTLSVHSSRVLCQRPRARGPLAERRSKRQSIHSSRAPHTVALGRCRHQGARTHAHVHPTDQGRCCGTAIAHVNQASLPESTHSGSHLIYLYTSHRQLRRAKTSPRVWLCVCFLCLIDNKRTSGSIPTRGFVFSQGELGLIA